MAYFSDAQIAEILAKIRTNGVEITDLTEVQAIPEGAYIEFSGGRKMAVETFKNLIIAAFTTTAIEEIVNGAVGNERSARIEADEAIAELIGSSSDAATAQTVYGAIKAVLNVANGASDKVDNLEAQVEDFAEIVYEAKACTFDVVNQLMINAETGGTNGSVNGECSGFIEVVAGDTYFVTAKFVGIYGIAGYSSASVDDYCANIASKTSSESAYKTEFAEDLEIVIPQGVTHIRISTYDKTNYPLSLKHRISIKQVLEDLEDEVESLGTDVESLGTDVDGLKAFKREIYPEYAHNREGYWRLYDYETDNPYISFAAASGWHCTDPIPIEVGDEFDITATHRISAAVHALLDENQDFLALLQEWNTPSLQHFVITQEQYNAGGRYVVFSFKPEDTPSVLKKIVFSPKENDERISIIEEKVKLNIFNNIRPVYAFSKAAPAAFRNKLALLDHDIEILMIGDSITAQTHVVSENEEPDAANRPCGMQRNGLTWWMWNSLCNNKPQCDRFDSEVNAFTESEDDWQLSDYRKFNNIRGYNPVTSNGNVGEFSQDNSVYRECNVLDAYIKFDWDLDAYENLAFIHRLGCDATTEITITCTTGKVEVYDEGTSVWVEANGYAFSQFIQYTTPVAGGSSCWVRQMILKMRKASNATGSVQLTFTNTGSGVMYYWGTERYNGNTLRVINLGKGGKTSSLHLYTLHDEIAYRHPDLVIYQLPVWNELKSGGSYITNWSQSHQAVIDLIKAQSNNWTNYQMMIFIPHTQVADWAGDKNKRFQANGVVTREITDEVSMTEITRVEVALAAYDASVPVINLNGCIIDFAHSLGLTMEGLLGSTSDAIIIDGTGAVVNVTDKYTSDGVHMSKTGAKFTANCLLPTIR